MNNPRFVQFGAMTTLPGPDRCESAELYGFFFRAEHDRLSELCTKVFREPTGGVVDYRPLGHHVLLTFGRIKRIAPQTPPFDRWGNLAEDQVVIWIPVGAAHDSSVIPHAPKFAVFIPYIWLDDPLSMATGRETGGWPKSWGWTVFSPPGEPLHLGLDVYGWQFGPDAHPQRTPLLNVTEGTGANGYDRLRFETVGDLFGELWSTARRDKKIPAPEPGWGLDLLKEAFRAELPQLFLKQIRSADDPETAALQQLITSEAKVHRLSGRPLFKEHHLEVGQLDSSPVRTELGLVDQVTRLGFKVEMDFTQERGRVIWDAAVARQRESFARTVPRSP